MFKKSWISIAAFSCWNEKLTLASGIQERKLRMMEEGVEQLQDDVRSSVPCKRTSILLLQIEYAVLAPQTEDRIVLDKKTPS